MDASGTSPKLKPAASRMIANEIDRDSNEPRLDTAGSTECRATSVGFQETVLGQSFCEIHVTHRGKHEPKHTRPVLLNEPFKVLNL
jgi:hypothetical protein